MNTEKKVTLGYWAIRGLAERIRQLMEYCGLEYDQVKYAGDQGRKKWMHQVKPVLVDQNAAINLPYLVDGDNLIAESDAICIYICHKSKHVELLGRNAEEQVAMATAWGVFRDMHPIYIRLVYGGYSEETFQEALKEAKQKLKVYLVKLNGLLGEKEYFAGGLTWIDFAIADIFQTFNLLEPSILADFPHLQSYQQRVWKLQQLQKYFKSEKFIERPCNNYSAKWK